MTALSIDRRAGWIDRTAVSLGQALTNWGTRHAVLRSAPRYDEQDARITASRDNAARILPQLPR
ncbi:hypothetical protein [Leifsonia poae]|uniref:Uncharacterized protein n=1 Tax=Leifsonia poae TaxID=110933 RepID=A0A9W6HCA3_9MICO|nr:hypothetical protein [Leifsonia poae]GLJ77900.1 hypothetical protein GCM10017584_34740 [Leifsonia poae]